MALNCLTSPGLSLGESGVILIEVGVPNLTVSRVEPVTPAVVDEIVVVPSVRPVTWPVTEMPAMAGFDDAHVVVFVR